MIEKQSRRQFTLLDGGMGRELMRRGAPFRQPEWSALALMEAPDQVKKVHESFAAAGSDILTTSNYAVVPYHIGEDRFFGEGAALTALSAKLARETATDYGRRVAGSIPPLFGSYRPELFRPERASPLLKIIVEALAPYIDLWLAETISSIAEAQAVAAALVGDNRSFWLSFTLLDGDEALGHPPRLRSGESVCHAVHTAMKIGVSAILFNCSEPEVMSSAVETAVAELRGQGSVVPVGVYANAFPSLNQKVQANTTISEIRQDLDPKGYLDFAQDWCRKGASIVGGCCGIGPEHISRLHDLRQAAS